MSNLSHMYNNAYKYNMLEVCHISYLYAIVYIDAAGSVIEYVAIRSCPDETEQGVAAMPYISATEAARRLGKSERTIRRWVIEGRITGFHPHGHKNRLAIAEQDVEALAQEQAELAPSPGPAERDAAYVRSLEQRIDALESQVERLVRIIDIMSEAALAPSERATEAHIPIARAETPAPVELPRGSLLIKDFAAMHGVNPRTFYDQVIKGIRGERVAATERPKPNRPGEVERWLTPEQQSGAIQFWLDQGVAFSACSTCPHGNNEYAALLGEDTSEYQENAAL